MVELLLQPCRWALLLRDPRPPCLTWTALLWRIAEISLDYTVVLGWSELCKDVCKKKVRHPDTSVFTLTNKIQTQEL